MLIPDFLAISLGSVRGDLCDQDSKHDVLPSSKIRWQNLERSYLVLSNKRSKAVPVHMRNAYLSR
jgi:hypothetical protein